VDTAKARTENNPENFRGVSGTAPDQHLSKMKDKLKGEITMKISREIIIDGEAVRRDIDLNGIELERAYNEYVEVHDKNEVIHQLKDLEYEDLENIPEDIIADLASQVRERMEGYRDRAILDLIRENEELLAPYKEKWKVFTKKIEVIVEKEYTIKARNESEAETLWEKWYERHNNQINEDMNYEMRINGDWDLNDDIEEDEYGDPEDADINEENARW